MVVCREDEQSLKTMWPMFFMIPTFLDCFDSVSIAIETILRGQLNQKDIDLTSFSLSHIRTYPLLRFLQNDTIGCSSFFDINAGMYF